MNDDIGRGLSSDFMSALKEGVLRPIVERVKKDHTLDFQIREEEVHIYYRGGRILGLIRTDNKFGCSFDKNYLQSSSSDVIESLPSVIDSEPETRNWIAAFPYLKEQMDFHFTSTAEKNEREFQQVIVRENNYANVANGTDFYVIDIEYVHPTYNSGRADLVAFRWKSQGSARKKGLVDLVFLEVKYGDSALGGTSGVKKHVHDMTGLARNKEAVETMQIEMLRIFRQKRELGLVRFGDKGNSHEVHSFTSERPRIIFVFINHDPASTIMGKELSNIKEEDRCMIEFASSNFMGYGLYEESIYSYDDFTSRFTKQINSK